MTKAELVSELSKQEQIEKAAAHKIVDGLFEIIAKRMEQGEAVKIQKFGTFKAVRQERKQFRNPKTHKVSNIQRRNCPKFIPSGILKKRMAQNQRVYL